MIKKKETFYKKRRGRGGSSANHHHLTARLLWCVVLRAVKRATSYMRMCVSMCVSDERCVIDDDIIHNTYYHSIWENVLFFCFFFRNMQKVR